MDETPQSPAGRAAGPWRPRLAVVCLVLGHGAALEGLEADFF